MFQKLLAITAVATITSQVALAAAEPTPPLAPVTRVEEDISEKGSTQKISWDRLAAFSPAPEAINQAVRADLVENACGPSEDDDRSYDYEATAENTSLNPDYVSYKVTYSSYCGGAHPNYGTYHLTFNAKTGAKVDFDKEVPRQDASGDNVDWDARNKYQRELAEVMFQQAKATNSTALNDTECYEGSDEEIIQQILDFYPSISGLGPDKKVITSTSPPHVATPCQFDLPVSLQSVEKFLAPDSVIKQWLK